MPERHRTFLGAGILLIVAAVACNELLLARLFSDDGHLGLPLRVAVWVFELALFSGGMFLVTNRKRLPFKLLTADRRALETILGAGILPRILFFLFQQPGNNDPHIEVVRYIVEHGSIPTAEKLVDAFHPPLYYLMAAPLAMLGPDKLVQCLSLALSLVNLWLLYSIISRTKLLRTYEGRCHALLLTALLPQFVIFGNFISNDALTFPLGTLMFLLSFRYIDTPSWKSLGLLGLGFGCGLLTKGFFLIWLPLALSVVLVVGIARSVPLKRQALAVGCFLLIGITIGSYKYVENTVHFGRPVLDNSVLKQGWIKFQQGTYQGPASLYDINVLKLVRYPFWSEHTSHSIPLLLYGTFWYGYIPYESNFSATRESPLTAVPRAIYLFGLGPTVLLALGVLSWLRRSRPFRFFSSKEPEEFRLHIRQALLVLTLLLNLVMVLIWGLKHDAWSFFQARLLFPSFLSFAVLYGAGYESFLAGREGVFSLLRGTVYIQYLLLAGYSAIELGVCALNTV